MKRSIMLLLSGVFVLALGPALRADEASDKKAVMDTMAMMTKAYVAQDMATLAKVFHDDMIYGHTDGHTETKAIVMDVAKQRTSESLTLSKPIVYVSGPVAQVRGFMTLKQGGPKPSNSTRGILWILVRGGGPYGWQIVGRQNWPTNEKF